MHLLSVQRGEKLPSLEKLKQMNQKLAAPLGGSDGMVSPGQLDTRSTTIERGSLQIPGVKQTLLRNKNCILWWECELVFAGVDGSDTG